MRLAVILLLLFGITTACEQVVIPDEYEGRYYGYDTVYSHDVLYDDIDTMIHQVVYDVVALGDQKYDVSHENGFWVKDGLRIQNKLPVNIVPFEGDLIFSNNRITMKAIYSSNSMIVIHKAELNR